MRHKQEKEDNLKIQKTAVQMFFDEIINFAILFMQVHYQLC
jgi:hypothetical protein